MSELTYATSLYYKHSGRLDAGRFAFALAGGMTCAIAGATAFAYIEVYMPIIYGTFLLILGFGCALGWMNARLMKWARVRNLQVVGTSGFLIGFAALYWAWIIWFYAYIQRFVPPAGNPLAVVTPLKLLLHPVGMWMFLKLFYTVGPWTVFKDLHPTGIFLAFLWLLEAGVILGCAAAIPVRKIREIPFCENCRTWGQTRQILRTKVAPNAEIRQNMEQKKFEYLQTLGPPDDPDHWTHFSLQGCSACDTTQTLTVDRFQITYDPKTKKPKTSSKSILRHLRLTPEETVQVCTVAALVSAPISPTEPAKVVNVEVDSLGATQVPPEAS